jgi:predicted CXXCH cytochrome family protein
MKLIEGAIENPYCMHCNTAEGALLDATTLAEVDNGITCAVCHDPHSHENPSQLREASVNDACFVCHAHESEEDFLHLDREYYDWQTEEIEDVDCATCHMYGADFSGRTESWDKNVNHTMTVRLEACGQYDMNANHTGCHHEPEAAWHAMEELVDMGMDNIASTEAYVEEAMTAFMTANTTAGADAMKLAEAAEVYTSLDDHIGEIGHAGTSAFHAPWYLEELLDEANMEAQELIHLSEAAVEPSGEVTVTVTSTVSEYGVQLLTVLGLAGVLFIAVLRRRKV